MLNLSALDSLRSLPIIAEYGLQAVFYYLLVSFVFLAPASVICSKLAAKWPEGRGVYTWISEAFGEKWGFYAVFLQWVHNTMWVPTVLSFVAAVIAYLFDPSWVLHKPFLISVIIVGIWGFTLINCFGLQISTLISTLCALFGTLIPGILLIGFGIYWVLVRNPSEIPLSLEALVPHIQGPGDLVFMAGIVLSFTGLELSSVHAREVKNATKNLPRAIFIAALMALLLYVGGALAIAIVVPQQEISLISGLMQAFSVFLSSEKWLMPIACAVILGSLAELNSWTSGPGRSLHAVAEQGYLPLRFQQLNRHGMPSAIFILQASLVTLFALIYLLMPNESSGFWILSALATQLYLLMYVILFLASLKIRKTHLQLSKLDCFLAYVGILSSFAVFCICFIPPLQIDVGNIWFYETFLLLGLCSSCLIPVYLQTKKHKRDL